MTIIQEYSASNKEYLTDDTVLRKKRAIPKPELSKQNRQNTENPFADRKVSTKVSEPGPKRNDEAC